MEIGLLNTVEELKFFPIDGKVYIYSDTDLEDATIINSISIFRLIDETGLFNFGDKYNQSIGYVREEFSTIPFNIQKEVFKNGFKITLEPLKPLHPNSNYALFIDKSLSSSLSKVEKEISKSNSTLKVEVINLNLVVSKNITITIDSDPQLEEKLNLITCVLNNGIEDKRFTVNVRSSRNYFEFEGVKYILEDKPYIRGERFRVSLSDSKSSMDKNLVSLIKTSLNADTTQIDSDVSSSRINYNDVLDYYKSKEELIVEEEEISPDTYIQEDGIKYRYIGFNKILCMLPKSIKTSDLDLDNIEIEDVSEAFDMYTLEQYGYFDPTLKYKISTKIKNEKEFFIIVEYEV